MKKWLKIFIILVLILIIIISLTFLFAFLINKKNKDNYLENKEKISDKINTIENDIKKDAEENYNNYIKTKENTILYKKEGNNYIEIGTIGKDLEFTLKPYNGSAYYELIELPYYVKYNSTAKIDDLSLKKVDYTKYISFGEKITLNRIKLYDEKDQLVFDIDDKLTAEVIMKDGDKKFINYHNGLYYPKEENIEKTEKTTVKTYAKSMPVLNYHFFYEEGDNRCNEMICIKRSEFDKQIEYLANNDYYTVTMDEFYKFITGKIRLPEKSLLITVDDGALGTDTILPEIMEKYNKRATLFLITSFFDRNKFNSPYVEVQSHGDNLHNQGVCSEGQGGGIKCLPKETIQADLKKSKDIIGGDVIAFAYPFYEYNNYAIENLKEAGFKLAFIGKNKSAVVGTNPYLIPRYSIVNTTTMNDFIRKIK